MKLDEAISLSGRFWLPGHEGKKIAGVLSINEFGKIELELVGSFYDRFGAHEPNENLMRIVGEVESSRFVTLEDCFYIKEALNFHEIEKSKICVNFALLGAAYGKDEELLFNTLSFSTEGLDLWLGITGISVDYEKDFRTVSVKYKPVEKLTFALESGARLEFDAAYSGPTLPAINKAEITHQNYIRICFDEPQPLDVFLKLMHKLTAFVGFAVDTTILVKDISLTTDGLVQGLGNGRVIPIPIKLYFQSSLRSSRSTDVSVHHMLFHFDDIRGNAEVVFKRWIQLFDTIEPAIGLYFSSVSGAHQFLESRFLSLAQAFETLHRRTSLETKCDPALYNENVQLILAAVPYHLKEFVRARLKHGNEVNLRQRLKRIIEPHKQLIGNSDEVRNFLDKVTSTRNFLTHYDLELEQKSVRGVKLLGLCVKLEAIFQLQLLHQLDFSAGEIKNVIANSHRLRQAFSRF